MTKKEIAGSVAVAVVLVILPALLWYWKSVLIPSRLPEGSRIIELTAIANGGIWTMDDVAGYNYWYRKPERVNEIEVKQGEHIVLRLTSVDVLHSFAIPVLRLGPVDVPAGHTVTVEFDADRSGVLTFLCWQMCSPDHPKLRGRFIVEGSGAQDQDEEW